MNHELGTPLTSILGALGLLKSGNQVVDPSSFNRVLDIAYNNADRLLLLVSDILDFTLPINTDLKISKVFIIDDETIIFINILMLSLLTLDDIKKRHINIFLMCRFRLKQTIER